MIGYEFLSKQMTDIFLNSNYCYMIWDYFDFLRQNLNFFKMSHLFLFTISHSVQPDLQSQQFKHWQLSCDQEKWTNTREEFGHLQGIKAKHTAKGQVSLLNM